MGTSLSGLTPATTFDGLLKTSDNEPLDGTLKTIGTGDGTDSILQLSDSALQVNGQATMVGLTNNTSASAIFAQNSDGYNLFQVRNDGTTIINNNAYSFSQPRFTSTKEVVIHQGLSVGQTASPTSRLHIKGSGTTSATTSLLVQNSEGSNLLQANDDGVVLIGPENIYKNHLLELKGSGSNSEMLLRLQSNFNGGGGYTGIAFTNSTNGGGISSSIRGYRESDHYAIALNFGSNEGVDVLRAKNTGEVGIGETTPTARLHVKGSGNDNTTTSLLVQNSDGVDMINVSDNGIIGLNPSDTGAKWELNAANNYILSNAYAHYYDTSGTVNFRNANVLLGFGTGAVPSTRVLIKGSGTTSATTSLLVQNSAGTQLLKVDDQGALSVGYKIAFNAYAANINDSYGISISTNTSNRPVRVNGSSGLYVGATSGVDTPAGSILTEGSVGIGETTPTARLQVKGSGNDATTTALLVQNSDGNQLLKVEDGRNVYLGDSSNYIHRGAVFQGDYKAAGNWNFGTTSDLGARLNIKGSGTTSATTALLVQNSAGTETFKVQDNGKVSLGGLGIEGGIISGNAYFANIVYGSSYYRKADGTTTIGGGNAADASAQLEVRSTTKGFLPPRMTTTERDAITSPAAGLMVYNTTTNKAQCYNGSTWNDLF